jgi:hypothetical protein
MFRRLTIAVNQQHQRLGADVFGGRELVRSVLERVPFQEKRMRVLARVEVLFVCSFGGRQRGPQCFRGSLGRLHLVSSTRARCVPVCVLCSAGRVLPAKTFCACKGKA